MHLDRQWEQQQRHWLQPKQQRFWFSESSSDSGSSKDSKKDDPDWSGEKRSRVGMRSCRMMMGIRLRMT